MRIIQAKKNHVSAIYTLISSEPMYLLSRSKAEIEQHILHFVVAVSDRKVVGCGAFEAYSKKIAEIRSLVILPSYRGKKVGQKIMARLLRRAKPDQEIFVVTSKPEYFGYLGFSPCLEEKYILFRKRSPKDVLR